MEKRGVWCCFCLSVTSVLGLIGVALAMYFTFFAEAMQIPDRKPTAAPIETEAPMSAAPTLSPRFKFNQCPEDSTLPCCNGLENVCNVTVDKYLFGAVHNAMSTRQDNFLAPNHKWSLERALEDGFRAINMDICNCEGTMVLCHGYCPVGTRNIQTVFTNIVNFLVDHPNEVLLLTLQINTAADLIVDINQLYDDTLSQINGFTDLIYDPLVEQQQTDSWPTLMTLINENKRLMIFHHDGPDCNRDGECPQGLNYYWNYASETQFEFGSVYDVMDTLESCEITRGDVSNAFFGVNVFLKLPDAAIATELNSMAFLEPHIQACSEQNGGRSVNLITIDYWSIGDTLEVIQNHNKQLQ